MAGDQIPETFRIPGEQGGEGCSPAPPTDLKFFIKPVPKIIIVSA